MPTQYQGFPLAKGTSREWTEAFTSVGGGVDATTLLHPDYHGAPY